MKNKIINIAKIILYNIFLRWIYIKHPFGFFNCPFCGKKVKQWTYYCLIPITVEKKLFIVLDTYMYCNICKQKYKNFFYKIDSLDFAYKEYRSILGWMQPDELYEIYLKLRKKSMPKDGYIGAIDVVSEKMHKITGLSVDTLQKIMNGSLQTEEEEKALRKLCLPNILEEEEKL